MSESKFERDARRNAGLGDIYIDTSAEPWINFSPGIDFKLLRTSQETGSWSVLFKCAAGASFARHEHLAAGEYLMVSGKMEIRGGVERGGVTAKAGDYGFEANGAWHDDTKFLEETVLYFTNYGPIRFVDDDDNTVAVLDYKMLREVAAAGKKGVARAA
jgi:2,4'-dihydroxyacetophenone dioxygenase